MQIIPSDTVRSNTFWFDQLIFNQMRMIKEKEQKIMELTPDKRTGSILSLYHAIRGLESIMWGKIEKSKIYHDRKVAIVLDFTLVEKGIQGQMAFLDGLDEWQKLLGLFLRAFDFYPATSVDFISGVGIKRA